MSAHFVEKDTIDLLVTAALSWGSYKGPGTFMFRPVATMSMTTVTWDDADAVGTMLWRFNYDVTEADTDEPRPWPGYTFDRYPGDPDPIVVLRTIAYFQYQTADNPELYDVSLVAGFMTWLQSTAVDRLPGMDQAPWGIDGRDAFGGGGIRG